MQGLTSFTEALKNLVKPLVAAVGAGSAVAVVLLAWMPVHASAVITGPASITEQGEMAASRLPGPLEDMSFEVHALTPGVELRLPPPLVAGLIAGDEGIELRGWRQHPEDRAVILAEDPTATVNVEGAFSELDLLFVTSPTAGRVAIRLTEAEPVVVDLHRDQPGLHQVSVSAGQRRVAVSERFGWNGSTLLFDEAVDRVEAVTLASLPTPYQVVTGPDGRPVGVDVSTLAVLRALTKGVGQAVPVLLVVAVTAAVALGLGALTEVILARSSALVWPLTVRFAAGLAVGMSLLGALNYYAPVSLIAPAVAALGAIGLLIGWRREHVPQWRCTVEAGAVSGVALALVAIPLLLTDRWAVGFLQTDVHDTFNLTQLFWERGALAANTDFGNGFRLLDYSTRAAVSEWALSRPSDAVVVLRLIFTAVAFPLLWMLSTRLCNGRLGRWAFTFVVGFSAALVSLYTEGYMTREFFAVWMIIGLVLLAIALHDGGRDLRDWVPAALAFAVAAALVPPYHIVVPALPLALIMLRLFSRQPLRNIGVRYRRPALGATLAFTLAAAPNLLWLRDAGDAQRYIEALNALARHSVVPFYASVRFPATLVGILPFHANDAHPLGTPTGAAVPEPLLELLHLLQSRSISIIVLVLLGITVAVAALAVFGRKQKGIDSAALDALWLSVLVSVLLGFLGLVLTQWDQQTYFVMMWAWTLAPVGICTAAIGLSRGMTDPRARCRFLSIIGLAVLAVVNGFSSTLEGSRWLEHPRGVLAARWHFDLVTDLEPFARALQNGAVPIDREHQVVQQLSDLKGTDDDRVLGNVLEGLLVAHGHRCTNCPRTPDTFNLLLTQRADPTLTTVVIGGRTCPANVAYRGERFVVCSPPG